MNITHCLLKPEMCKEGLCGPQVILLRLEDEIVLYQTYWDPCPADVTPITPFDEHGIRLIQVPVHHVDRFMTLAEADQFQEEKKHENVS